MLRGFAVFLVALGFASHSGAQVQRSLLTFADLRNWETDSHKFALSVFQETCGDLKGAEWAAVCAVAGQNPSPRLFFETFFVPILVEDSEQGLFTGYFEPEILASPRKTAKYRHAIYRLPDDIPTDGPWKSRREIESSGILQGRGLELAWIENPVDVFYLQIQGSGRLRMTDGSLLRVGYGGGNGHPYRSVGKEMIRQGVLQPHQVSADRISNWVAENPERGRELLWHNPSYVFFRNVSEVPANKGPLGAMNRPLTQGRSVAVDPRYVTLGAPVWLEKGGVDTMNRLMIAQDTGSAIKGAQRADLFYGTGPAAGFDAGLVRDSGRMVVLVPRGLAANMLAGE